MSAFSREIDEKIVNYSNYLETVSPTERPHIHFMIHNAKLMKNKLTAMLAELDVIIAENNLKAAVEQLETFKKYHSKEEESKKSFSPIPKSAKNKTRKESNLKAMSSTETGKNNTAAHTMSNIDKENTKPASSKTNRNKTSQDNEKAEKCHCVPERGTKRRHSDSSRSSLQCKKKQKRTHATDINSNKATNSKNANYSNKSDNSKNSNKSTNSKNSSHTATLLRTNMSPIKETSQYITQGVQTCNWLEQVKAADTCRRTNRQGLEDVPRRMLDDNECMVVSEDLSASRRTDSQIIEDVSHRILDDDECTVIIEDLSVKTPDTQKDAINISKALRQIMSPRKDLAKDQVTADLTQMPVSASMKILFEDEPEQVKKKSHKVKSESPEAGDDVFIL